MLQDRVGRAVLRNSPQNLITTCSNLVLRLALPCEMWDALLMLC